MFATKLKQFTITWPALLYVGMVLFLAGGLEIIRRVGNTLTAPHHIAGTWYFQAPTAVAAPCPLLLLPDAGEVSLQIEQSGRYLMVTFPDAQRTFLHARFDGTVVQGSGSSLLPCARGAALQLTGHVQEDRLELTLTRHSKAFGLKTSALALSATRTPGNISPASSTSQRSPRL